jgi:hypothetical protein
MSEHIIKTEMSNGALFIPYQSKLSESVREEIVRCRDCKWFTPEYRYEEEREYGVMETLVEPPDCGNPERCSHHYDSITGKVVPVHIVTDSNGFCAWGERRGD